MIYSLLLPEFTEITLKTGISSFQTKYICRMKGELGFAVDSGQLTANLVPGRSGVLLRQCVVWGVSRPAPVALNEGRLMNGACK